MEIMNGLSSFFQGFHPRGNSPEEQRASILVGPFFGVEVTVDQKALLISIDSSGNSVIDMDLATH